MLIEAKNIAKYNKIGDRNVGRVDSAWIAPIITIPDIALVTLIRGECKIGVTYQMAKYPIKQESMNMFNKHIYCFSFVFCVNIIGFI